MAKVQIPKGWQPCSDQSCDMKSKDCQGCVDNPICQVYWKEEPDKEQPEQEQSEKDNSNLTLMVIQKEILNFRAWSNSMFLEIVAQIKKGFDDILGSLGIKNIPSPVINPKVEPYKQEEMDVSPEQKEQEPFTDKGTIQEEKEQPETQGPEKVLSKNIKTVDDILCLERSVPDDDLFKVTFEEMMSEFACIYNEGYDISDSDEPEIVKGEAAFKLFQTSSELAAKYQLGKKRDTLGVIRIVANRIYGVPQNKTFELITEEFCKQFGIELKSKGV